MATASASAASGRRGFEAGSSTFTIIAICDFSAWPTPTTVFFTRLAAYSATEAGERRRRKGDAARLAELQRRLRVAIDEGLLDRRLVGAMGGDDRGEPVVEFAQPIGEGVAGFGMDRAAGDEGEPRPVGLDHAPAGMAQAGIDAENANRGDVHGRLHIRNCAPAHLALVNASHFASV